jgi:hypothetical protein
MPSSIKYIVTFVLVLIAIKANAQNNSLYFKGVFKSLEGTSYEYNLNLYCLQNDTLKGTATYIPLVYGTLKQRWKNTYSQDVMVYLNKPDNTLYIQEGYYNGKQGGEICYMAGLCSYTYYKGYTYIFGQLTASYYTADSCYPAIVCFNTNEDINKFCTEIMATKNYEVPPIKEEFMVLEQLIPYYNKADSIYTDTLLNGNLYISTKDAANTLNQEPYNYYTTQTNVQISISDYDAEDDDLINVYLDDKLVLSKHKLTIQPIILEVLLNKTQHTICIEALNEGMYPPNSALLQMQDSKGIINFKNNASQGSKHCININAQ